MHLQKELEEFEEDMQRNLREMESCFDLLIPRGEELTKNDSHGSNKRKNKKQKKEGTEEESGGDWRCAMTQNGTKQY